MRHISCYRQGGDFTTTCGECEVVKRGCKYIIRKNTTYMEGHFPSPTTIVKIVGGWPAIRSTVIKCQNKTRGSIGDLEEED